MSLPAEGRPRPLCRDPTAFGVSFHENAASLFVSYLLPGTSPALTCEHTHTHTHTHTHVHPARDSHIPDFTGRPEATPAASRRYRQNYDKLHKYVQIVRMMSCAQGPPEPAERRSGRSAQDLLCIQLRQLHPICLHLPRRQAHRLIPIAFTGLCPSRTGLQGLALRKALGPARGTPRTPRGIGDSVWGSRVLGGCSKVPARVPWGTRRMSLVTCAR